MWELDDPDDLLGAIVRERPYEQPNVDAFRAAFRADPYALRRAFPGTSLSMAGVLGWWFPARPYMASIVLDDIHFGTVIRLDALPTDLWDKVMA